MGLREYHKKRDFAVTPEPRGEVAPGAGHSFVIQKHAASRLHYDFRLEHDGVLKSWSVPKGPSLDPRQKRLAVMTEDHPVDYGGFEGIIPKGEYGGGTVLLWDQGTWTPEGDAGAALRKGALKFELHGQKLHGRWALVRIRGRGGEKDDSRNWLLVKEKDGEARSNGAGEITATATKSVTTGRELEEIARDQDRVWHSNRENDGARPTPIEPPPAVKRARKAALPAFVPPALATLVAEAPAGDEWLHEMKFDGFRILARKDGAKVTLLTRTKQDWTARFPDVAAAVARLPAERALLDGEVAVLLPDGTTSFQALQNQGGGKKPGQALVYFVFDLLHQDGRDLAPLPLETRKQALAALTRQGPGERSLVRYTDHVVGAGPAFFAKACQAHLEGIVSKRKTAAYVSGRGRDWVKTKCVKRQEFVIGGFTEPNGARKGLGALLVGFFDDGKLRYAGKVGTGYTQKGAEELRARLARLGRATAPFSPAVHPVPKRVHWVKPQLLAEVGFTEMTSDGKLRHPSFAGLREDKAATEVVREKPEAPQRQRPAGRKSGKQANEMADDTTTKPRAKPTTKARKSASGETTHAGVRLTNPERLLYPDLPFTKRDLAAYYEAVAPQMVPQIADRPLSLVRCPEGLAGECFFMKHSPARGGTEHLRRVDIREQKKTGEYLVADTMEGLVSLAQMSVLEVHTWNSTTQHLEQPDRVVFDLDPGPKVAWPAVAEAARAVRARLQALGFDGFVKSTGGKGLHVVVPLEPADDWNTCLVFSRLVSELLVNEDGGRYTTEMAKAGREDKILIDYYRNQRGATSVAAYSTRAKADAPVSAPLAWEELDEFSPARPFTVKTMPARMETRDPWRDYDQRRHRLAEVLPKLEAGLAAPRAPGHRRGK
jgi:bifunctional non-homologous end joining protein LigD